MMYNINDLEWDEDILWELDILISMLLLVKFFSYVYGYIDECMLLGVKIFIVGCVGD